jgi:rhodanese-related sulfurtransferase
MGYYEPARRLGPERSCLSGARSFGALERKRPSPHPRGRRKALTSCIVVERNHLEWRLHPDSAARIPEATSADVQWIVLCEEGYASSLAAAVLQALGLRRATDDVGGLRAWRAAGMLLGPPGEVSVPRLAPEPDSAEQVDSDR